MRYIISLSDLPYARTMRSQVTFDAGDLITNIGALLPYSYRLTTLRTINHMISYISTLTTVAWHVSIKLLIFNCKFNTVSIANRIKTAITVGSLDGMNVWSDTYLLYSSLLKYAASRSGWPFLKDHHFIHWPYLLEMFMWLVSQNKFLFWFDWFEW